ncbi:MAG: hypothetical protein EBT27_10770 [Betaproteobacteria bacterium]|nr:hypothetical protein [Betaproteobacteria bacterium]
MGKGRAEGMEVIRASSVTKSSSAGPRVRPLCCTTGGSPTLTVIVFELITASPAIRPTKIAPRKPIVRMSMTLFSWVDGLAVFGLL